VTKSLLLLRLKDGRSLFTESENYSDIEEFVKVFEVEVAVVRTTAKPLKLGKLAKAISDGSFDQKDAYQVVRKVRRGGKRRGGSNALRIKNFIRNTLLGGKVVSMYQLKRTFQFLRLTDSCLCTYFSEVRRSLAKEGKMVEKVGAGQYRIQ
jgi:hypothetical protein